MNALFEQLAPAALTFVGTVGTLILGWLTVQLNTRFAVQKEEAKKVIESLDRDTLHMALTTAARLAESRGLIGEAAVTFILNYVRQSSPGAISNLGASRGVLEKLAESKLVEAVQSKVPELLNVGELIPGVGDRVTWKE